jgi:hypothetical protein
VAVSLLDLHKSLCGIRHLQSPFGPCPQPWCTARRVHKVTHLASLFLSRNSIAASASTHRPQQAIIHEKEGSTSPHQYTLTHMTRSQPGSVSGCLSIPSHLKSAPPRLQIRKWRKQICSAYVVPNKIEQVERTSRINGPVSSVVTI